MLLQHYVLFSLHKIQAKEICMACTRYMYILGKKPLSCTKLNAIKNERMIFIAIYGVCIATLLI